MGGKVIFVGKTPSLNSGQDVHGREGEAGPELRTLIEPVGDITPGGAGGAAQAGCEAGRAFPADVHAPRMDRRRHVLLLHESTRRSRACDDCRTRQGSGLGPGYGRDPSLSAATSRDSVKVPCSGPYEAKVIVVGPLPKKGVAAAPEPSLRRARRLRRWMRLEAGPNGKQMTRR